MTNRKFCSDITGILRANNIDDRVSYRLILSTGQDQAQTLIKQDADSRRLFKQADLWKVLPCVELEEVPLIDCWFDVSSCRTIKKSKEKIPDFYSTGYGSLLRVSNVDGSGNFTEATFESYKDFKNRRFSNPNNDYFWIVDDYLYIPDTDKVAVRVSGFFKDSFVGCEGTCVKPLDLDFNCPDYLVGVVKTATANLLLERFKRPIDERGNLNSNEK